LIVFDHSIDSNYQLIGFGYSNLRWFLESYYTHYRYSLW